MTGEPNSPEMAATGMDVERGQGAGDKRFLHGQQVVNGLVPSWVMRVSQGKYRFEGNFTA
jgi:hypothetical protein